MKSSASKLDTAEIAREIEDLKASLASLIERVGNGHDEPMIERVKNAVNGSVSDISRAANERLEQGRVLAEDTRAMVADSADRTATAVKENPILSLAIAAGIGLLVGSLTRNR